MNICEVYDDAVMSCQYLGLCVKLGNKLDVICQRDELLICPTFSMTNSVADRHFIAN